MPTLTYDTAESAREAVNLVRRELTHIDDLIVAEIERGGKSILVSPTIITDEMITSLKNKDYNVTTRQDSLGTYKEYKISWE